jgi:cytoskeleton protein RodZ
MRIAAFLGLLVPVLPANGVDLVQSSCPVVRPRREPVVSIGQALSAARRDAGLSIEDISAKTRLRATVVRAIEADDFSLCGGDFYARGHIRTLAGLVGLDPAVLLAEYDATVANTDDGPITSQIYETEASGRAITRTAEKRSPNWGIAAIATTLVAVIAIAIVGLVGGGNKKNPPAPVAAAGTTQAPAPTPTPPVTTVTTPPATVSSSPPSAPTSAVAEAGVHVLLKITTAKCWVAATASNGQVLYQGVLSPGATQVFDDPQRVTLRLGNAPATDLTVNGVEIGAPQSKSNVTSVSFGPGNPLQAQG